MGNYDFAIGMGGAPGKVLREGTVTVDDCARRGVLRVHLQCLSIPHPCGHTFLTMRLSSEPVANHGDKSIGHCIEQDAMDSTSEHRLGGRFYNSDNTKPERMFQRTFSYAHSPLKNCPTTAETGSC